MFFALGFAVGRFVYKPSYKAPKDIPKPNTSTNVSNVAVAGTFRSTVEQEELHSLDQLPQQNQVPVVSLNQVPSKTPKPSWKKLPSVLDSAAASDRVPESDDGDAFGDGNGEVGDVNVKDIDWGGSG